MQDRRGEYEVEEVLMCRELLKSSSYKFQVKFKYKVLKITENMVAEEDEHNKNIRQLPLDMLMEHFMYNYCFTCRRVQGSTIEGGITLFDYNHCLVDKNWLSTAITREADSNNVSFFNHDSDEDDEFNKRCICIYTHNCLRLKDIRNTT